MNFEVSNPKSFISKNEHLHISLIIISMSLKQLEDGVHFVISLYENKDNTLGKKITSEVHVKDNKFHRINGPALIMYKSDGRVDFEQFWLEGEKI